ncbi:MAG: DUF4139 domain-containing protein [Chitinivibrionales bacterium]|nr:DUF4139 domain-containing protein [Chitinivibrionales bacterium]
MHFAICIAMTMNNTMAQYPYRTCSTKWADLCRTSVALCLYMLVCDVSQAQPIRVLARKADRSGMEITVYNANIGLVKDTRTITMPRGKVKVYFEGVAADILPSSVTATSTSNSGSFTILEQNYEYDLINRNKLLNKYVGKRLRIIQWNEYQDRTITTEANLISNNDGPVYRVEDKIYLDHPGYVVLPALPEGLVAHPTLIWLAENRTEKAHTLEASYLTENINWKANYILLVYDNKRRADLNGWVTLDNRSGASFPNATLKLVAGKVNRVQQSPGFDRRRYRGLGKAEAAEEVGEEALSSYHLYTIARPVNIDQAQTKQIRFFGTSKISVAKEYLIEGSSRFFRGRYTGRDVEAPVLVIYSLTNSRRRGPGRPLPAGIIRGYVEDSEGQRQFIGEDRIDHTPVNKTVKLEMGAAFDITAERRQTAYNRVSTQLYESAWEIEVKNQTESSVRVDIIEHFDDNWEITQKSHSYEKFDAFTVKFTLNIPKKDKNTLTYRVRVGLE